MKKLLVVVDYQVDFVSGSLGFDGAELIESNILELIKKFQREGQDIVSTRDCHFEDYMETTEGLKLPISHCIKGTEGFEIMPKTKEALKDAKNFDKPTFGSLELGKFIEKGNYDEVYLCGLVSDICVFSNAVIAKSAISKKGKVFVVKNATTSFNLSMQEKSFDMLKNLHIDLI